jgi:hypothetical protein
MNKKTTDPRSGEKSVEQTVEQLTGVLQELSAGHEKMLAVIKGKHEAMRKSDVQGMLATSAEEGTLSSAILATERKRLDVSLRLCGLLKIGSASTPVTIKALAARLPTEAGQRLLSVASALRERMLKVAEANRVVELVCQRMLGHFKAIFSAMAESADAPPTYSPSGNRIKQAEAMVLDAVG